MIHWGFLFLAFITGVAVCYGFLYWYAKLAANIDSAIDKVFTPSEGTEKD